MFENQNGLCAICNQPETKKLKGNVVALHVDHDHKTGKIRGLLCFTCNIGLGLFQDNKTLLFSALEYVERHER